MSRRDLVEIHTATGPRQVVGDRVEGGLALHATHNDFGFTITHVGSGMAIWRLLPDLATGREAMTRLLMVADWTADGPAIGAQADVLRHEMRVIAGDLGIDPPRSPKRKRRKRS